jgi:putative transposase
VVSGIFCHGWQYAGQEVGMRKSKFSESQIVAILKEADSGIPVGDVLRSHGISSATFYKWRSKYGGLEASELKRIKELEQQLAEFKTIVADLTLENKAMRGFLAKK